MTQRWRSAADRGEGLYSPIQSLRRSVCASFSRALPAAAASTENPRDGFGLRSSGAASLCKVRRGATER